VERHMFPKHTNSTEMGSGFEAIVVTVSHVLGDFGEECLKLQENLEFNV